MSDLERSLENLEAQWRERIEDLKNLIRIPSISFPGFPSEAVFRSAEAVSDLLSRSGFDSVEIIRMDDVFPYVLAEKIIDPQLPTVLCYAHHDVQPPLEIKQWKTHPFEPVEKEGPGGPRLYGRGAADDKAGILVHAAAVSSMLQAEALPLNVKVLIEGEEEIGSAHLSEFLNRYRERLSADYLILTDTMNYDSGIPGLTTSLRGNCGLDIELRALEQTVHSGLLGGAVPDPAMGLAKLLAQTVDENGQIKIPAIRNEIPVLNEKDRERYRALPFDQGRFRQQAGLLSDVQIGGAGSPWVETWTGVSLAINAIQSSSRKQAGNTINASAWARVSVRVPPGMNAQRVLDHLKDFLKARVPWGLELHLENEFWGDPWAIQTDLPQNRPVFEAGLRALEAGYGVPAVLMGCGASIPFVQPFSETLGLPALLIGVEDPFTNAHGENESLLLSDLKKACKSEIYLFEELAKLGRKR